MKILAVEFSSTERSVAVLERSSVNCAPALRAVAMESTGHRGIGLVEQALAEAKLRPEDIAVAAVGLGPGSYTGIRSAIALAQGWQLGRSIKLLGISSVACLAAQAHAAGQRGSVNIIVDAQRNEFYFARYRMDLTAWHEVEPLRLAPSSEIEALAGAGEILIGPGIARWFPTAQNMCPSAATLGKLAATREDYLPGEKLEPIYLRETAFKKAPPLRVISSEDGNKL